MTSSTLINKNFLRGLKFKAREFFFAISAVAVYNDTISYYGGNLYA